VFALVQRPLRRVLSGLAPPGSAPFGSWPRSFGPPGAYETPQPEADAPLFLQQEPLQSQLSVDVTMAPQTGQPGLPAPRMPILRALGQAGTTYVIAEGPAGLYLIDQHAAHERVLFERFLRGEEESKASQPLLAPVLLELTPQQGALTGVYAAELLEHGFEVEPFGGGGYLLRAAPAGLRREDPARAFIELLELVTSEDSPGDPRRRVAASLACHAAVRAGQTLAPEEMRDLIHQLESCDTPQTCPHGRPTMLHLSADELARRFSRK
jgi:DNA mismatch repair protein MutL